MVLRKLCIALCFVLATLTSLAQQKLFDTEPTQDTSLQKLLPGGADNVFNRDRGPFMLGWNWDGPATDAIDTVLGITANHHSVYPPSNPNTINMIQEALPGTRFLMFPNHEYSAPLFLTHGNGKMTRVDFEIAVDTVTGLPVIESDTNTGAVHGFSEQLGTVVSSFVELRGSGD